MTIKSETNKPISGHRPVLNQHEDASAEIEGKPAPTFIIVIVKGGQAGKLKTKLKTD